MYKRFPIYIQPDAMDCGPACLKMIASFYGQDYSLDTLRNYAFIGKDGVSLKGISEAAEKIGFKTIGGRVNFYRLIEKAILPCIIHWDQEHFVVLYEIKKKKMVLYSMLQIQVKALYNIIKMNFPNIGLVRGQIVKIKE